MTTKTQTQTPQKIPVETIINMLGLDSKTVARIYESIHDDRFIFRGEGEEIIMTVGPIECDSEGYADVALTAAEAIALAIRLIKYATETLMT
jgi:hypothetical protein